MIGHWHYDGVVPPTAKAFTYEVVLISPDFEIKQYVGYKNMNRGWKRYTTSSELVHECLDNGWITKFKIINFYDSKESAIEAETNILRENRCRESDEYLNQLTYTPQGEKIIRLKLKQTLKEKRSALTKLMDNRNRYNSTAKARGKEIMFCPEEIQLVRAFIKTIDINGEISDMDAKLKLVEEYIGYFNKNKQFRAIPYNQPQ